MQILIEAKGCSVLKKMSRDRFVVHHVLHKIAVLIDSKCCKAVKDSWMDLLSPVCDYADYNSFPGILAPSL